MWKGGSYTITRYCEQCNFHFWNVTDPFILSMTWLQLSVASSALLVIVSLYYTLLHTPPSLPHTTPSHTTHQPTAQHTTPHTCHQVYWDNSTAISFILSNLTNARQWPSQAVLCILTGATVSCHNILAYSDSDPSALIVFWDMIIYLNIWIRF